MPTYYSFDVASRSDGDIDSPSRADCFPSAILSSDRTPIRSSRIPLSPMIQRSPWHLDISPILSRLAVQIPADPQALIQDLSQYDMLPDPHRSPEAMKKEREAHEQLVLDLSLSQHVFTSRLFSTSQERDFDNLDTMSRATQAMSLGGDPPPIHFGFLRPIKPSQAGRYLDEEAKSEESSSLVSPLFPAGPRLLLQEWTVGTDPAAFHYHDPYDSPEEVITPRRAKGHASQGSRAQTQGTSQQTLQPPTVIPSKFLPPVAQLSKGQRPALAGHLEDRWSGGALPSGSQPNPGNKISMMFSQEAPSTQVLPGLYGGRPSLTKKKPVKKRLGGF